MKQNFLLTVLFCQSLLCSGQGVVVRPSSQENLNSNMTKISDIRLITDFSQLRIGDWVTSEGKFSYEKIPGINYAGVIFSLSPTKLDAQKGWTHGYIVALEDAKRGRCLWGPKSDVQEIPNMDYPDMHNLINDRNGYSYSNCSSIKASSNNAFSYARSYPKRLPSSFSGWFLPSVGQWIDIIRNLGKSNVQEVLRNQSNGYTIAQFDVSYALANLKQYGFKSDDYSSYWTANECIYVKGYKQEGWVIWLTDNYDSSSSYLYTLVKETTRMGVRAIAAF
ncbi:MAG: hypothetical protein J1E57_06655 [Prevotella sp.]|nr:hypothetical protein [Prevotella sp.]